MKKLFIKNPFKRLQKGSVAALCIFSAVMLILAGSNNSCVHEKLHEQEPIIPCDPKLPFHPWAYDFVKE